MKIDQDLRIVIRAAEKAQQSLGWDEKNKRRRSAIDSFLASKPAIKKAVDALVKKESEARAVSAKASSELCKKFGLRLNGTVIDVAQCDEARNLLKRKGFKYDESDNKWRFETVIAELAAAAPDKRVSILKKYGINWS